MGRKAKSEITLADWGYNPTSLKKLELSDLKKLYTKKRDIAQKRLKRLIAGGFEGTQIARKYKQGIPTLKSIKSSAEGDAGLEKNILSYELSKLQNWLEDKYSRVGELKKTRDTAIATLHSHGFNFVNKANYSEFVSFMSYLHMTQLDRIYSKSDSDTGYSEADKADNDPEKAEQLFNEYKANGNSLPLEYFMYK